MKNINQLKKEIYDREAMRNLVKNKIRKKHIEELKILRAKLKTLQEVCKEIKRKIKIHEKHFDRYSKEVKKYAKDKKQVEYSDNQAIKEMNIIDELKELLKKFQGDEE